jgi:ribosome-binding protein aMBF1 (putative translation factor)
MPRKDYDDEEQNDQDWNPIILKKEPIITKDTVEITIDQFIYLLKNKRDEQKLSVLQLNEKCKFSYKYTIRDIESGKTIPSAIEIKKICSILNI